MRNAYGVECVPVETVENNYFDGNAIYLKLTEPELTSLALALRDVLASHGVKMSHEKIVESVNTDGSPRDEFPANSHLGELVQLYRRVDAARHGRKTWNAEWRSKWPHNRMTKER